MDTAVPALPGVGPVWPLEPDEDRMRVRTLEFVEVTAIDAATGLEAPTPSEPAFVATPTEPRWSLFGELES